MDGLPAGTTITKRRLILSGVGRVCPGVVSATGVGKGVGLTVRSSVGLGEGLGLAGTKLSSVAEGDGEASVRLGSGEGVGVGDTA